MSKGIFLLRHDMPAIFGILIIWEIKYSFEDESFLALSNIYTSDKWCRCR
jgi:hypothetical protein